MRNHIKEILFALSDGGVEYIVGGGVAAVLHGVERVTLDIDIALNLTKENLGRFISVVSGLGMTPRVPVPLPSLGNPDVIRMMVHEKHALVFSLIDVNEPLRYLDVFLTEDLAYPNLLPHSDVVAIDGRAIRIIGCAKLLAIKKAIQPPRDKDELDIRYLEKLLADKGL
ncbi:MAG TPA: hypothetical protein PKE55_00995 [Kiritimatiellia bacterium]|nr:hypothetical protein [Kiritimatiellia bacterium]